MIEERLRTSGLKATQSRIAVVRALESLDGHPRADEVLEAIVADGGSVARATVFNALEDLVAAGLVMRADAGPGAARYEVADTFHHHFVCSRCGELIDVPCRDESGICLEPAGFDGHVENVQVIYRGVCTACLAAAE